MAKINLPIYDLSGKTMQSIDLDPSVFGVATNATLLHQVITTFLANRRAGTAHTKGRAEVRGGGRKPWRQKGTGNARVGSSRSPIWRGGGVTFGPRNDRNYSKRLPLKMRQAAFRMLLSDKVANKQLIVVADFAVLDGKTKSWIAAFKTLPQSTDKALVVDTIKNDVADRSIRNIANQKYVGLEGLTAFDLARFSQVIMAKEAVEQLTARLAKETKPANVAVEAASIAPTKPKRAPRTTKAAA